MATGTIFDIKKYAIHDGPGIRTTVFFKGCPLDCWWCHNPEGRNDEPETICVRTRRGGSADSYSEKKELFGRIISVDEVMEEIVKDTIFYDQSGGGVTFSGGEPLMQPDFLFAILKECRNMGIHTVVDTSGYAPADIFDRIYNLVDLFLYDLKTMDDEAHIKYTGVSNRQIRENLIALTEKGNKTHLRLPMIPGVTDTEENTETILSFIQPLSAIRIVNLLPYNRLAEDKLDRFNLPSRLGTTSKEQEKEIEAVARKFEARGYRVQVGG